MNVSELRAKQAQSEEHAHTQEEKNALTELERKERYIKILQKDNDFDTFIVNEVRKEITAMNDVRSASDEAKEQNVSLEDVLIRRTAKLEVLEKIFNVFLKNDI